MQQALGDYPGAGTLACVGACYQNRADIAEKSPDGDESVRARRQGYFHRREKAWSGIVSGVILEPGCSMPPCGAGLGVGGVRLGAILHNLKHDSQRIAPLPIPPREGEEK